MYEVSELKQMVFIDIETTTGKKTYDEVIQENPELDQYWQLKYKQIKSSEPVNFENVDTAAEMYPQMAALYPEWGKIICISIGQLKFDEDGNPVDFSAKSYYGDDEKELLEEFNEVARKIMNKYPNMQWVGHNIKGFDLPYILKRSIIHGIKVPKAFHLHKQKPWENCLLDTQEVWKFGGWNSGKLGLLTEILGIPSPKEDLEGIMVSGVYWEGGNLERIKDYCEKDILATANLMLKISYLPIVVDAPF
jgi:DNA polymerase elongation subunit (family B)